MENPTEGAEDVRYYRRHRWYCGDDHKYSRHHDQYRLSRRRIKDIKKATAYTRTVRLLF